VSDPRPILKPRRGPGRPAGAARRQRGRAALLSAARALLAERGVEVVSLREIAARAGVRPPLVHYYFGSRQGLLQAVIEDVVHETRARLEQLATAEGDFESRFRAVVRGMVHSLAAEPYLPRLMIEQVLLPDDEVTDRFAEQVGQADLRLISGLLAEGSATGVLGTVELRFAVPALMGVCIYFFLGRPMLARLFGPEVGDPETVDRYADWAAELMLQGLRRRPAEA